jgi:uncharacterized membrane protein
VFLTTIPDAGGACVTITIIVAGLIGSGVLVVVASGSGATQLKPNTEVMVQFILPISVFAAALVTGVVAGYCIYYKLFWNEKLWRQNRYYKEGVLIDK